MGTTENHPGSGRAPHAREAQDADEDIVPCRDQSGRLAPHSSIVVDLAIQKHPDPQAHALRVFKLSWDLPEKG